jgi:hypothetical protein
MAAINDAGDTILRLASEFAAVEVGRDDRGNGPRLMIRDTQSGRCVFLDPARFERRGPAPQDE